MIPETLTIDDLRRTLDTYGGGLLRGGGHQPPIGSTACQMCVRELRTITLLGPEVTLAQMREEWTDEPDGRGYVDSACQTLNDAEWSSAETRTEACLPLALLSEQTAPEGWHAAYMAATRRTILPSVLRAAAALHPAPQHQAALEATAVGCAAGSDVERDVLYDVVCDARFAPCVANPTTKALCDIAADMILAGDVSRMTVASEEAAVALADGDAPDAVLRLVVAILIASHEGPEPWASERVQQAVTAWEECHE